LETLLTSISNYGFPMVVAVYLLLRMERKLDELAAAINRLGALLERPPG
jgi:hypothetical protein